MAPHLIISLTLSAQALSSNILRPMDLGAWALLSYFDLELRETR